MYYGNPPNFNGLIAFLIIFLVVVVGGGGLIGILLFRRKANFRERKSEYLTRHTFAVPGGYPVTIDNIVLGDDKTPEILDHVCQVFPLFGYDPDISSLHNWDRSTGVVADYALDFFYDSIYWAWIDLAMRQHSFVDEEKYEYLNTRPEAFVPKDLPPDWQERRRAVLERDKYTCALCDADLHSGKANVHHVIRRADGGTHVLMNLVTLCDDCHGIMIGHETIYSPGYEMDSYGTIHAFNCHLIQGVPTTHLYEYPSGYQGCYTCCPVQTSRATESNFIAQARATMQPIVTGHLLACHEPVNEVLASMDAAPLPYLDLYILKSPQRKNSVKLSNLERVEDKII